MSFSLRKQHIVCFSTADWDTLLPTNKHHLMRRLAAKNNRVLFIETLGTRAPQLSSGTDLARIGKRLQRGFAGPRKREKRLWSISPIVRPKWSTRAQIALNRRAFQVQCGRTLARFPKPIAWVYSPYAAYLLDTIEPSLIVYHMVDDLAAVPGADASAIREAETLMLSRADVVICTERSLHDRARRVAPAAHFMPNVADYDHFSTPGNGEGDTQFARLRALPKPRVLFSGNLAPHKLDFGLIHRMAEERADWQFVLVGPLWEGADSSAVVAPLQQAANIHFIGHVDYERLPPFLHEADVLVIPYVRNEATRAVSPLKLFEYLATGRPVVSSPLQSVQPYHTAVRIADSAEDWMREIEAALGDSHALETQRRALARRHTWEKRIGAIEKALGEAWHR